MLTGLQSAHCWSTLCCTSARCFAGAGQGIGRAFAHALGEAGASVAIVDINFKKAQAVTEELRSKGIRSIAVGTDVTKKADCKKYVLVICILLSIWSATPATCIVIYLSACPEFHWYVSSSSCNVCFARTCAPSAIRAHT